MHHNNIIYFLLIPLLGLGCNEASGHDTKTRNTDQVPKLSLDKNDVLGRIKASRDKRFVKVPQRYMGVRGRTAYLRKETYKAFQKMTHAAAQDGIRLRILSGFRSYRHQQYIWEAKWTGKTLVDGQKLNKTISDPVKRSRVILRFSSMPGTSRHHWGTEVDLNFNEDNSYFEKGDGKKVYQWLQKHASKYGFCQTYTQKGSKRPHGYNEEKWHWSHLPIAHQYHQALNEHFSYDQLKNFKGSQTAPKLKIKEHYIDGICPKCAF